MSTASYRPAAGALAGGTLAGLVTMAFHPTGQDVVREASADASNTVAAGVHLLAIAAQAFLLAGMLALVQALRTRREIAVAAYACFALATLAVVVAATASGLLAPATVHGIGGADAATRAAMTGALRYTGMVNRAFATVFVVLGGLAVALWSWAMLAERGWARTLAVFGLVLGPSLAFATASGWLRLDVHGFGLVVVVQGAWTIGVAWTLWRLAARGPRDGLA